MEQKHKNNFEECSYCLRYIRLYESFGQGIKGPKATMKRLHKQSEARLKEGEKAYDLQD